MPNNRFLDSVRGGSLAVLITLIQKFLLAVVLLSLNHLFASVAYSQNSQLPMELRLNQIQVIGTHNSYHIAPATALLDMIRVASPDTADGLDYTHRPLKQQFDQGIRQIELDIYADPDGGLYSDPVGYRALKEAGNTDELPPNHDGQLDKPGMKIIHAPGFDYRSTVPTLLKALEQVRDWSLANQSHVPIMVLLELKDSVIGPAGVTPIKFNAELLRAVDDEILSVFEISHLITPDLVRGEHATLRDAITQNGWPKLAECQGKILFALDNGGRIRDLYLKDHPSLRNRIMFASVEPEHPAAAFIKLNDPVSDFHKIQAVVKQGLIVRTRADADTREARSGDTTRREAAFSSGAQFISTDYPEPDKRFSNYQVRFEHGASFRLNPILAESTAK